MIPKLNRTDAAAEQGFIIVAVLWILAALAALATIFSIYLSNTAQALAVSDTAVEAEGLVSASVELTAYQLLLSKPNERAADGSFQFRLGHGDVVVSFVSEGGRIDLNGASKQFLANLLSVLGAEQEQADQYAERIVAWRSAPKADSADNEPSLYRAAGLAYSPRQAPFAHAKELALILGMPPVLVERALPFVTVFTGASKVDVLVAAPEVIAALPGMTPSGVEEFLKERPALGKDQAAIAAALGPAQKEAGIEKSNIFRILTTIKFASGRRTASEVVIRLGGKEDPYQILSWQDDVTAVDRGPRRLTGG